MRKSRFLIARCLLAAAALAASGCATMFNGTQQSVSFNTDPQGAWCVLSRDGEGVVQSVYTPERAYVRRDNEPVHIVCKRRGYKDAHVVVAPGNDNAANAGNLLNYTAGTYVDFFTDAFKRLPDEITVPLEKK